MLAFSSFSLLSTFRKWRAERHEKKVRLKDLMGLNANRQLFDIGTKKNKVWATEGLGIGMFNIWKWITSDFG